MVVQNDVNHFPTSAGLCPESRGRFSKLKSLPEEKTVFAEMGESQHRLKTVAGHV